MTPLFLRQLVLSAAMLFMVAGQAFADKTIPAWQGGTVKVVIPRDYTPTYYQNTQTGKADGFAVEVLSEIARLADLKFTYVYGKPWQEIQEMLLDGRGDIAPLAFNEERDNRFYLTNPPIDTIAVSLFVLNSNTHVTGIAPGLAIGALRSSVGHTLLKKRHDLKLVLYEDVHKLLFDLLSGDLDAVIFSDITLIKLARDIGMDKKIHSVGKPLIIGKRCIAVRKTDLELQERLSRATAAFIGSPQYLKIYQKWWGEKKSFWSTNKVILLAGASALTVALIMACWRYYSIARIKRKLDSAIESAESERSKTGSILDSINDGISIFDREKRLVYQNPAHIKMFGYGLNKTCQQIFENSEDACPVDLTFKDANPHVLTIPFRPGCDRFLEVSASPLIGRTGGVSSVIVCVRDITEQKKTEEILHQQALLLEQEVVERKNAQELLVSKQQQLEILNTILEERVITEVNKNREKDSIMIHQSRLAAMGEMIGNIAHQWRQPLNNIGLLVQGLELDMDGNNLTAESMRSQVTKCMNLINYMSGTIDDFRNFYSPEKHKEPFWVADAVDSVLSLVKAALDNNGITLVLTDNGAGSVFGYANEYAQVLLNVINNAKDALLENRTENPVITVCCENDGEKTIVTVHDNAGGVPDLLIDRIFDPYFTTKDTAQGTGVGLYMAKMIIEKNMHGTLTVSNKNNGALFKIEV